MEQSRITSNTAADVDDLVESPGTLDPTQAPILHGAHIHLSVTERMVVSASAGIFKPDPAFEIGAVIQRGTVLGAVGEIEVRSAFAGELQGFLAHSGERVTAGQPIAWLRK
jgi:biotin carboxyl carrier protein